MGKNSRASIHSVFHIDAGEGALEEESRVLVLALLLSSCFISSNSRYLFWLNSLLNKVGHWMVTSRP